MSESSPKARCVPLSDDRQPPEWVRRALYDDQLSEMTVRSKWFLSLDHVDLTPAERLVLYRLWFFTSGKQDHYGQLFTAWPAIDTLARKVSLSRTSVRTALNRCEQLGLLQVERSEKKRKVSRYTLAWPVAEPPHRQDRLERFGTWCLAEKKDGRLCHRPAGWGTTHAGEGRCKLHGGTLPVLEKDSTCDSETTRTVLDQAQVVTPNVSLSQTPESANESNVVAFKRDTA